MGRGLPYRTEQIGTCCLNRIVMIEYVIKKMMNYVNHTATIMRMFTAFVVLSLLCMTALAQKDGEDIQRAEIRDRNTQVSSAVADLAEGNTLFCDVYPSVYSSTCSYHCVKKSKIRVRLHANGDANLYRIYGDNISVSVPVDPMYYAGGGAYTVAGFTTRTLSLNITPTVFQNEAVTEFDISGDHPKRCPVSTGYAARDKYGIQIMGAIDLSGIPLALRPLVKLEVTLVEEMQDDPTKNGTSTTPLLVRAAPTITNPVTLAWSMGTCADQFPMYEVQILRLYNTHAPYSTTPAKCSTAVDWSQAASILVYGHATSLTLTLAEGTGYYLWRVRPIGDLYPNFHGDSRNWGVWTDAPSPSVNLSSTSTATNVSSVNGSYPYACFYYDQFDADKNWQFSRAWFEATGGKPGIAESMTYATELLQPVQTQKAVASTGGVMVQQTVLDNFNRPALVTMPSMKSGTAPLAYEAAFAKGGADVYVATDYDKPGTATAMTGQVKTYWTTGTLPSPGDYAYSRTVYDANPLARPAEQAAPGPDHAIGAHTVKTVRTSVTDAELVTLFGDEAPNPDNVVKIVTTDQNDVVSVTYALGNGRTIATCLVNDDAMNTSQHPLNDKGNVNNVTMIDTIRGGVAKDGRTLVLQDEITVLKDGPVEFYYGLQANRYKDTCESICRTCDYDVVVTVRKQPENTVVTDAGYTGSLVQEACAAEAVNDPRLKKNWTSVNLTKGSYTIERVLTPKGTSLGGVALDVFKDEIKTSFDAKALDAMRTLFNGSTSSGNLEAYYATSTPTESLFIDMLKKYNLYKSGHATIELPGNCCTVTLPAVACTTGCEEGLNYESYMLSKCGTFCNDSMRKRSDALYSAAERATAYPYFALPDGTQLFTSYTEATGWVNTLMADLIAAGYPCDKVWACWASLMDPVVLKAVALEKRTSGGNTYYVPRLGFNLLDYFIDCLGPKNCGKVAITDRTGGPDSWLTHPWRVVPHDATNADENACLTDMGYNASDTLWSCTLPQQSIDDVHALYAQLAACLRNARYKTIYRTLADGLSDADGTLPDPSTCDQACYTAKLETMQAECETLCENREAAFRDSVVAMYLAAGYYVEGVSAVVDPVPIPNVTKSQIACAVNSLVAQCKADCSLTPVTFVGGNLTSPTAAQMKRHQEARTSQSFRVSLPEGAECTVGSRAVTSSSLALDIIADLLNERLKSFRAAMTMTSDLFDVKAIMTETQFSTLSSCMTSVPDMRVIVEKYGASHFFVRRVGNICRLMYTNDPRRDEGLDWQTHALTDMANDILNYGWGKVIDNADLATYFTGTGSVVTSTNAYYSPSNYYTAYGRTNLTGTAAWNDPLRPLVACPPNVFNWQENMGSILPPAGLYGEWTPCGALIPCVNGLEANLAGLGGMLRIYSLARAAFKETPSTVGARVYGDVIIDMCGLEFGYGFRITSMPVPGAPPGTTAPSWSLELRRGAAAPLIVNGTAAAGATELDVVGIHDPVLGYATTFTDQYGYFRVMNGEFQYVDRMGVAPNNITVIPCLRVECDLVRPDTCADVVLCESCDLVECPDICFRWVQDEEIPAKFTSLPKSCARMEVERLLGYFSEEFYGTCLEKQLKDAEISYNGTCWDPKQVRDTVLVKRTEGYHYYTLYYYDRAGSLMKTVPPKGFVPLVGVNAVRTNRPGHTMVTKYAWNSLGQLVKEQTPDGGVTQFWYNDKQQLRVTQKANQGGKFTVTDYDDLGRIVRTCEVTSGSSGQTLADLTSAASGAYHVETTYSTAATLPSPYASLTQRYLLNRVSTAVTDEDGSSGTTDDRVTTYYSYDPHGNVEWVVSALPGMTSPVKVDYEYDLITGKVMQMNYQRGYQDRYFVKYAYDADLRVTEVKTSTDSVIWERDAGYAYYAHGPLQRMALGQEKVSGVDHAYTIHGWLKGINHPSLDNANDPGNDGGGGSDYPKDAFGMTLSYYANDFVKSGSPYEQGNSWSYTPTSLYNGNIAGWIHSARDINGTPTRALAELYGYDFLNRIVADTGVNRATGGTSWDSKPAGLGALGSAYTYDPNGNLKTVQRQDASAQSVDNLTYTMVASTNNLLDKVVDATTGAASSYTNDLDETQANGNYAYDAIGNLTKDVAAGIAANGIVWTPYGKIKQITNATYRIEYLYDAMGNRVRQKRTKLSDNTYVTTYYGRDASGKNVIGTYEKIGTGSTVLKEVPLYGSSRLGILRPNATQSTTAITPPAVYTRTLGKKEYEITDHLGNVRVSVSDRLVKPGSDWLNDVKTQTDYFPYGMQREDRNDNVAGYRYGYNGKENDNDVKGEGNQQDYGFRIYDPRVARFLSVDPLTKNYPWYTPYQFAGNTPIQAIDLDGLEPVSPDNPNINSGNRWRTFAIDGAYQGTGGDKAFFNSKPITGAEMTPASPDVFFGNDRTEGQGRYVTGGSVTVVDESTFNSEKELVNGLLGNFIWGHGSESYAFPENGKAASYLRGSIMVGEGLAKWNRNGRKNSEYPWVMDFRGEINVDVRSGLYSLEHFIGSARLRITTVNADQVRVEIFNVTSLSSGDLAKEGGFSPLMSVPRQGDNLHADYSNVSQYFNMTFTMSQVNGLLKKYDPALKEK